ncbi:hypothetical protein AgCh_011033 [Apium graveolens]
MGNDSKKIVVDIKADVYVKFSDLNIVLGVSPQFAAVVMAGYGVYRAINWKMAWLRCNWATKGAGITDENPSSDAKSVAELTNTSAGTQIDLHCFFHALRAGVIEEVRVQRDKAFGFVRYSNHSEAALAIQLGNTQSNLHGRQIKGYLGMSTAGASQAIYDGGFQNVAAAQQLMYYQ